MGLAAALGVTVGMAYASFSRQFDLPIQATVTIRLALPEQAADVDGDGIVDSSDLLTVLETFNTGQSGGDVDQSGTVDIFDLAYVARYIFQLVPQPPTATPVPPTPTPLPPTPTPGPALIQADIRDFSHENLRVPVGSVVIWTNQGGASHTSTSGNPPSPDGIWESGVLSGGQSSAPVAFETPGTFPYYCRIHLFMLGAVTVD